MEEVQKFFSDALLVTAYATGLTAIAPVVVAGMNLWLAHATARTVSEVRKSRDLEVQPLPVVTNIVPDTPTPERGASGLP